jgi:hypothetical protein
MTPEERLAALAMIRADKGLPPKNDTHPPRDRRRSGTATSASSPANTMISYAEVADPNPSASVVSGMTQPAGVPNGPPPASSSNSLRQVLTSNQTPAPATTNDGHTE